MAKRTATTELTDRNWDQEEEPEEAGEFAKASNDAIKQRHIIKAKRKNPATEAGFGGAFSGFGGFSFKPTQTSTPLLGFGQKTETKISFGQVNKNDQPDSTSKIQKQNGEAGAVGAFGQSSQSASASATSRSDYLSNLKALNNSVLEWITQHVRKNPYCILTPIFKDYEKHLGELEKGKEKSESNGSSSQAAEPQQQMETAKPKESELKPSPPKTGLTFGLGQLSATKTIGGPSSTPFTGFGFNPTPVTVAPGSGFSFAVGTSKPLDTVSEGAAKDEEEYVPPKPEVKEIEEEGSLYSKKCKLFYQKDGAWTERGVGHLHLKKIDDKTQLLVRADTNLGNILLNIMLSPSVPLQKQGKNNVSMVCVPNPPVDPKAEEQKPVPMLIRVKTSDDADELLAKMNEMKN